ncbi:MAG: MIP family channel protein [Ignavibacteria bacterium]|nr:MIP family channel protein [Ignavibacteria bacterium]
MNSKAFIAEFIGTFALIFVGVGAIAADYMSGGASGLVGVALAHGLVIAVMVSATGAISGGHLNPAVTIAALIGKKIDVGKAFMYIVAQCLGAIVAALLIKLAVPAETLDAVRMGTPALGSGITLTQGLITEIVLTFFVVFVVYGTAIDARAPKVGGLFIGLTVTLDILMGGPITGAAMNPARHLGPALMGGGLQNLWLYWVGPIIGGAIAGLVYHNTLEQK